jgi:hypothetical protein
MLRMRLEHSLRRRAEQDFSKVEPKEKPANNEKPKEKNKTGNSAARQTGLYRSIERAILKEETLPAMK